MSSGITRKEKVDNISSVYAWETGPEDILDAAAHCFAQGGYCGTTFEQIANRLECTTGRVFHYYSNKTDLFLDVHRVAVGAVFTEVLPIYSYDMPAFNRLCRMSYEHVKIMFETLPFQMVVREGIENYIRGATTSEQREKMEEIIQARKAYSSYFRDLLVTSKASGELKFGEVGIAVQLLFMTLNAPAFCRSDFWQKHPDNLEITKQIVTHAITGLGAHKDMIKL